MSYGILNTGRSTKDQAMTGLRNAAQLEQNRNLKNDQIERQEDAADASTQATAATSAATLGAGMASSAGLGTASILASGLASGGIGLVAGLLLTELF